MYFFFTHIPQCAHAWVRFKFKTNKTLRQNMSSDNRFIQLVKRWIQTNTETVRGEGHPAQPSTAVLKAVSVTDVSVRLMEEDASGGILCHSWMAKG